MLFVFAGLGPWEGGVAEGGGCLQAAGERAGMATKQAKKKATRKAAQPVKASGEGTGKARKRGEGRAAVAAKEGTAEARSKPAAKKRTTKLDKKKLGEMVDKMLLHLAEQVEEGECKITTSEGVRLIQLREALGLERPSTVKVEWVEPKGE